MKKNYLTSNIKNAKSISLKQRVLALILIFSVSFAFAQRELTFTTTSTLSNWNVTISNPSTPPDWTAIGNVVNLTEPSTNTPVFDLSANTGTVEVKTTGTPPIFSGIRVLQANYTLGLGITSIDVSDLNNLETLLLGHNLLTSIDVTNNLNLKHLGLNLNDLSTLDISQNTDLEFLFINGNQNIATLDISNNPNLKILSAEALLNLTTLDITNNSELIDLDLEFTSLTSAAIDDILNKLDAFGKTNGILNLQNTGGMITKAGIGAYLNLLSKGWNIKPPQSFDFGDAPAPYPTTIADNGPIHLVGLFEDLRIGQVNDKELDGFPSANADGDDNDNLADEDGVLLTEFDGILTSATSITINLQILNNYANNSYLHAWIDLDGNGTFDTDEYATLALVPNTGVQNHNITWDITALGADINEGPTYARFRLTKDNDMTASDVGGYSTGGEVEDYTLNIGLDTDGDGVQDTNDLDADNDGILNTDEVGDTNGNGIDDMLELDSDDDTCLDVTEAGFTDGDGDGILGTSPVVVDANGLITDDALGPIGDGYTTPNDLDINGTYDFQEAGAAATITTEPTDQPLIIGVSTFSVIATADTYQWEESQDGGTTWVALVDGGDYAGATTADLLVTNSDVTKLTYRYRVIVNNIAYACDPTTTSVDVGYITPDDFDLDSVFDIVDEDDDNDGILDVDEDNGVVDRDTDGDGSPDRIDLDSDGDTCYDVTEAGFTDVNGNGMLGDIPVIVDLVTGRVTSGSDGYTLPVADLNANGTPDFQEAGVAANITTEPVDQIFVLAGSSTFSVVTDLVAGDESFQWEESIDNGITWNTLAEGGDYTGVTTADLTVSTPDFTKVNYRYRVLVSNIAYACDPVTESTDVTFITPGDFDNDTIFDVVDEDDDNDGILDVDEDNGVVDRDTDGDGNPDRIDLDADGDGCNDVTEAGFTDDNGDGELGDFPVLVNGNGRVISGSDGYTPAADADGSGTPDFQEAGAAATITTEPTDQPLIIGVSTFSVVATADTYQWEESQDGGTTWVALVDGGDYAGATLADLLVTNSDLTKLTYRYRVIVSNIAYACDPTTTSVEAGYFAPDDFDLDGVYDIVDVDDDNDGILDTDEGDGLIDTDGDGSPDNLDLDADGDGCFDVTEAGFTDVNGNGMLGDGSPTVDLNGQVTSGTDGYTTPADADGNGTPDFQEAGAAATITTEPTDQDLFPTLSATFSVTATADTYQWEESIDAGATWTPITDGGNYSGATTADLTISNLDVAMRDNLYRVNVNNIAYACDPVTTSATAGFISLLDTDGDNVPDLADLDDDNDGILDTDEGDGAVDTDGDGIPDSLSLDSDGDGCSDVTEAGFENNGADMLGNQNPPTVDANGQVTSATDGYTTPNDLDNNGTPDFQEAGVAATITTQPVDQDFDYGNTATFSVVTTGDTYQWEESTDNGATWTSLIEGGDYTGVNTDQLTVSNADINMYFNDYRVVVNNIAFACDPGTPSDVVTYNELPDSDNDTIFDIIDTDDDNDGILDTVEGDGDTDGDGLPDRIDLDSDNDGCPDVTEAGFTNNGADMLGTSNPPTIDANGQVTSSDDGYTTPNDLNTNGVFDFQEAGSASDITSQPVDTEITLGDDATFTVSGNATYYQWQVSTDRGSTWVDVEESDKYSGTSTSTLTIYDARSREESNLYRVLLTSPDYACDPNPELYSAAAMLSFNSLLLPNGFSPNGDGKNDTFIVTGLAQYPNFTMEVFDRWGNSVYRYENNGSLDPQWWDGYAKGSMILNDGERVPAATYFYMINYNDDNESPRKGWVYVNY